jgi:son of sevenless
MSISFNDFLALQSDLSMRQPRDVPADLPYMAVMDRALCMVEVAALKKSLDHLAPFTACVIGIVRAVLSSAQCLLREATNLQRFPELQKTRKAVLGELARLVGQTKKVGGEMEGEVELTHDEHQEELEKTMKISMALFNNVQLFVVMCLDRSIHIQEAPRGPGLLDVVEEPEPGAYMANASTGQSVQRNESLKRSPSVGPRSTSLAALRGAKSVGDLRVGTARNSTTDPVKAARRARVIHGRGARSPSPSQATAPGTISTFRDMGAQGRTEESTSSLSSLESSPFTPTPIAFPCGACASTVVLAALRTVLDSLLGVTAAFIGHAQLHSRTSHPASKGTLIALTRQLVDLVRKLLTIVEAVVQHEVIAREKQREVLLLSHYKDMLYISTNTAVDGVRELTNQPPTPSETEDQERAAVVAAVTDTLKLCAECGNAVRLCLSRKMGEDALVIWIPQLPGSPKPTPTSTTEPGLTNVFVGSKDENPMPNGEMMLRQRAKTTDGLRAQFIRDGEGPTYGGAYEERGEVVAEEEADQLQLTARDRVTVVTADSSTSTSGRPRGDSGSSASTDASRLFEDEEDHRSRASSARTSGEPKALVATEIDQSDDTDAVFSTLATWNSFSGQESVPSTPLTADLDEKKQLPTALRMLEERQPSVQHHLQKGDMILDPEGNIVAATFEALIERLTHPDERPDLQLMTHFLLTFRVFATPIELVDTLIGRWAHVSPPEESRPANFNPQVWDTQTLSIRARVVNFITEWTKIHWYPPTDMAALPKLIKFMNGETSDSARRLVNHLQKINASSSGSRAPSTDARTKAERMNMLSVFVHHMDPSSSLPPMPVATEVPRPSMTKSLLNNLRAKTFLPIHLFDFDPTEMARQLTIMENRRYSEIPMQEMIEKVDGRSVPHVKAVSDLSNAITGWITMHVLKEASDLKKRAAVIKFFLKVYKVRGD